MAYVVKSERCEGCGSCVGVCPEESIRMRGDLAVVDPARCTNCGNCEAVCPVDAMLLTEASP